MILHSLGELDFVRTKWDMAVDEFSVNPGNHIFEKMISGMYMGELIRQVLLDLMKDDLIFFNCNRERLLERGSFYTRFASEIESDPVGDYTRYVLKLHPKIWYLILSLFFYIGQEWY